MPKSAAARHFAACKKLVAQIAKADAGNGKAEAILQLRIQPFGSTPFWLDLEMRASATLKHLDSYLRAIWLECCGHMSHFAIGGWSGEQLPMSRQVGQVLRTGVTLTHLYDYGTMSTTLVKCAGVRQGKPLTRHPITLLGRNCAPAYTCAECEKPAAYLCIECLIEDQAWVTFCSEHARKHARAHYNYGEPVALMNSPRLGMCGYVGPAVPPY
jgi:hypothetical protein